MHSFLIDMCRSCLKTNVNLKEYMLVEDKEIKCFDAVKFIFPNTMVPEYFRYGYSLCKVCINLLKNAVIFQRRLSESHNAYNKYMETLNFSIHNKFSILIFKHIYKGCPPMLKTDKESRLKQTGKTSNQIPTNETYFQDILIDEDFNCDTCNDFDNFLSGMNTNIGKEENISVKISEEECGNMDNVVADSINIYDKKGLISDNDSCYQLDSKIDVKEHILAWESETQCKNEIFANNISAIDLKQENTTTIIGEEKTSAIILTKLKVNLKRRKPYKSQDCKASFPYNSNSIRHKNSHTGKRPHKCVVCEKSFSYKSHLSKHKLIHTGERPYKCDVCEKSFSRKDHLITHKRIHTGERPYKCNVCEKSFSNISTYNNHRRIHTGERPYKCDVCEKSFSQRVHLITHKRIHTGERPYKCNVCEKSFSKNSTYINHRRIHIKLIKHKRIHTESAYICDVCKRSFCTNSSLIIHKRIHTGERPYKCDVCEKSFSRKEHLSRHNRIHTGERPYKCDICENSFSTNSNYIEHRRIHTGERPYKCDVCEKSFSSSSTLARHKRIHTGKRPYVCDVCEKSYSNNSNLISHKCIHTG